MRITSQWRTFFELYYIYIEYNVNIDVKEVEDEDEWWRIRSELVGQLADESESVFA